MGRAIACVFLGLLSACEGPPEPIDAAIDVDAGSDAGPPCVPPVDDPFACEDRTPDPSCAAHWVVGVTGRIVTSAGEPVENGRAQLCVRVAPDETLVCLLPPRTDANGEFAIVLPEELRCVNRAAMRAIAPARPLATTYCPIDFVVGNEPIVDLGAAYVLHPVVAATVPPVGDEIAQRDVTFADGLVLTLAPVDLPSVAEYEGLSGAPVSVSATECFSRGSTFDGAYAFNPEAEVVAGAAVSIPNEAGLAPGAIVDLFVLGGLETRLIDGSSVEEGVLAAFGPATVTADGARIVSDADTRLPYLSWLVWRAR
mgnify:CR=1 FL=1